MQHSGHEVRNFVSAKTISKTGAKANATDPVALDAPLNLSEIRNKPCPLWQGGNQLFYGMHLPRAQAMRFGLLALLCFLLAGCAYDMAPYSQAPSMEVAVQAVLAKQGYYQGPIDGRIGPATSRAIRNYQRDSGLTPTGTINPALVARMGLAGTVNVAPAPYYSGYYGYAGPAYYSPPAVIGLGWSGGWPVGAGYGGYWNRGWGGYGGCWNRGWGGYRGYGGRYGYRGYGGGNNCRGWR